MAELLPVFLGACLVNNLILDHLLGVCPGTALSRKLHTAAGLSLAMGATLVIAALVSYPLRHYFLEPLGLEHLELMSFVFVIMAAVLLGAAWLERGMPELHGHFSVFVPLLIVNCTAVGAALLNVRLAHGFAGSLFFGAGAAAGYGLVVLMLSALQDRLSTADIPAPFRGAPILLMTLGLLSMAFMGFSGLGTR